ncbi:MAG: hypothetical protein R3Y58_05265, partial [Eubacteriales bacterium]
MILHYNKEKTQGGDHVDYIPIIISVFGITISMLSYMMGQKNGTKKEAEKQGKLNSDIEYIKKDVAEIKKDVKTINVDQ